MRRGWALLVGLAFALSAAGPAPVPTPRVLRAWAAGLFEVRVAFAAPIDPGLARAVVGLPVQFEEFATGKADAPASERRATLRVAAARLEEGRELVLTTDPHPRAGRYSLMLPGVRGEGTAPGAGRDVAVSYDLTGVEAAWALDRESVAPAWSVGLPALDPAEARRTLGEVPSLRRAFDNMEKPGWLTLTTLVNLPPGPAVLRVVASSPVEALLNGEGPAEAIGGDAPSALFRLEATGDPVLLTAAVRTGRGLGAPVIRVTVGFGEGARPDQALGVDRMALPWAPAAPPAPGPLANPPDLKGGDPARGAVVFAGEEGKCARCHKVRGQGGEVGPDLSGLVGRERLAVYRDIAEPSAWVHPEFVSYTVALKDGKVLVGTVRAEGAEAVRVTDTEAKTTVVRRDAVEEFRPSATSIMPVGLAGALGEARVRDLVAFLTAPPGP